MLQKVKTSLRISHNLLNNEINSAIASARLEMDRAGVNVTVSDELIETAIITYCKHYFESDNARAERYLTSFQYQCDNLRKTPSYSKSGRSSVDV